MKPTKKPKRPRDPNLLALAVVMEATGEVLPPEPDIRNPHAVELGKLGGAKGGRARADKLTAKQRKAIAEKAAAARWKKGGT